MTALRTYRRDRGLPARLGDVGLVLPEDEAFGVLVASRLAQPGTSIASVELIHARWKPGVALVGLYRVVVDGHGERLVGFKRHVAGKGTRIAERFEPEARAEAAAAPLLAHAPLEDGHLWTFPADRELRGAQRAFDPTRLARRFDDAGLCPGFVLRKRATDLTVLRYKPERRVVARLDAKLRGVDDEQLRAERTFGLRLLPAEQAAVTVERRRQLESALVRERGPQHGLVPKLVHFDERDGLIVEEWRAGATHAPDSFEHGAEAAVALRALHSVRCKDGQGSAAKALEGLDVLARLPGAASLLNALTRRAQAPLQRTATPVFVHGDFHPDQVLMATEGPCLLDLDTVGFGAPEADLASWIADHLTEAPERSYTEAALVLVREYTRSGGVIDVDRLGAEVGAALVARSAAVLRRLEAGAEARAGALLVRAEAVLAGEDAP